MKAARVGLYLVLGLVLCLSASGPASAQVTFTDVAPTVGLDGETFRGNTGHALGACWIDYNADNWPDLFVTNGWDEDELESAHIYRNDIDGSGTFTKVDELLPPLDNYEMMGCIFADYDNDGDDDIYVFRDNEVLILHSTDNPPDGPANLLLHNMWVENGGTTVEGEPLFVDVAPAAGVADLADPAFGAYPGYRSTTGSFLDYDRDGFVDLYVTHWWTEFGGEIQNKDRLYHNNGNGTFTDVTDASGMNDGVTDPTQNRPGLAAMAAHLDQDLWPDVYVVNVHDDDPYHNDFYYRNDGDGTFTESSALSPGLGLHDGAGMGIDTADVENDGDWDIYISDIITNVIDSSNGNAFHTSNGDGTFADNSADAAGIHGVTSWGIQFFDADLDGFEDLFVGGAGPDDGNVLYHNLGMDPPMFADISGTAGVSVEPRGVRGATTADFDNDGDIDLLLVNQTTGNQLQLMQNNFNTPTESGINNWIKVRIHPSASNGTGIGAMVKVRTDPGAPVMRRQLIGGNSTHSQEEMVAHFGVGTDTEIHRVQVVWPNGGFTDVPNVAVNQTIDVSEDSAVTAFFTDVTAAAGVEYEHGYPDGINGPPRRIAGGVAAGDYNNDSLPDIYVELGTLNDNVLLKNNGDGTFTEVAATGGIELGDHKGSGPTFGDIDGDGLLDLFVGAVDGDEPKFFRNLGNDTFQDISLGAGISHGDRNTFSAAFADYNEDGLLDLGLAHWDTGDNPCGDPEPCTAHLYKNNGNFTFTDDDVAAGITGYETTDRSFAPNFTDWTGDGKLDLLMVGDFGTSQVFENDGDGTFTNVTDLGVITDQNGMGTAVGDFDNDLDMDWFVSSIFNTDTAQTGNRLYENDGAGAFIDSTDAAGVRDGSWGWGGCFSDFNNDGHLDLFHVNGFADPMYQEDPSRLFMNAGDGTFSEMAAASSLVDTGEGRGIVCFDYDRDGDLDIFVSNNSDFTKLYRNDGATGNFLNIALRSRTRNVYGIGAKIIVSAAGESQLREMKAGSNFASQNPAEAHFGLGNAGLVSNIQVQWPDGIVNDYGITNANQFLELKQFYDSLGLYVPQRSVFFLKNLNESGPSDTKIRFGSSDLIPITGDWDGTGIDRVGIYDPATGEFSLRDTNDRQGGVLVTFQYGDIGAEWLPIAGDWDGDGVDTIGLYSTVLKEFRLRNDNSAGDPDIVFGVSPSGEGWLPLAGDWDNDGKDGTGIYLPDTGQFKLKNENGGSGADHTFIFGAADPDLLPLAGDWNGNSGDSVGVYDPDTAVVQLRNTNDAGGADLQFAIGPARGWTPIAGVWN
jgi:hypothetical protein